MKNNPLGPPMLLAGMCMLISCATIGSRQAPAADQPGKADLRLAKLH
ncbi:MAG: hypothetical protein JSU61_08720 [Fidelibacterota bacterium]|nr:MAG: hypothetical protein JSU61_08720 [Candidatus Neomarinimicrobiota bacterium]